MIHCEVPQGRKGHTKKENQQWDIISSRPISREFPLTLSRLPKKRTEGHKPIQVCSNTTTFNSRRLNLAKVTSQKSKW